MYNEGQAKLEQDILLDMLKLFITNKAEEYGYYFSEVHEHKRPEDIPTQWSTVYYSPVHHYYDSGEYNIIETASTKDYVYYSISLHGSSFASALTEYVKIATPNGRAKLNDAYLSK